MDTVSFKTALTWTLVFQPWKVFTTYLDLKSNTGQIHPKIHINFALNFIQSLLLYRKPVPEYSFTHLFYHVWFKAVWFEYLVICKSTKKWYLMACAYTSADHVPLVVSPRVISLESHLLTPLVVFLKKRNKLCTCISLILLAMTQGSATHI